MSDATDTAALKWAVQDALPPCDPTCELGDTPCRRHAALDALAALVSRVQELERDGEKDAQELRDIAYALDDAGVGYYTADTVMPTPLNGVRVALARVQELEAALRGLKHQYLAYMPACHCPTCRAIDRALLGGAVAPQVEDTPASEQETP